jgi:hypothetical protein
VIIARERRTAIVLYSYPLGYHLEDIGFQVNPIEARYSLRAGNIIRVRNSWKKDLS